ncbi:hypothetical protein [Mycoplasma seminis]|uniref:Lipoprotein n=1 Tax=Mycoplasma seminis TaxID=512749 RepID=A0ABY9HBG0_9MOLU|nr:hypothetical protein [Mycoplasma seminis]WLP85811.1 hypothetical protein Q8852_01545 [Mycoplasma seminis]
MKNKFIFSTLGILTTVPIILVANSCIRQKQEKDPVNSELKIENAIINKKYHKLVTLKAKNKQTMSDNNYYSVLLKSYIETQTNKKIEKLNINDISKFIDSVEPNLFDADEKSKITEIILNPNKLEEIIDNNIKELKLKNISQYLGVEETIKKEKITNAEWLYLLMCSKFNDQMHISELTAGLSKKVKFIKVNNEQYNKLWDFLCMFVFSTKKSSHLLKYKNQNIPLYEDTSTQPTPTYDETLYNPSSLIMKTDSVYKNLNSILAKNMLKKYTSLPQDVLKYVEINALNDFDYIFSSTKNANDYYEIKSKCNELKDNNQELYNSIFIY